MKHQLACGLAALALLALPAHAGAQDPAPKVWNPPSIYPDLSAAPPQDVADARRLWQRSKTSAKRLFPTVAATRARGYKGNVKNVNRPKPFFFHLRNTSYSRRGRSSRPRSTATSAIRRRTPPQAASRSSRRRSRTTRTAEPRDLRPQTNREITYCFSRAKCERVAPSRTEDCMHRTRLVAALGAVAFVTTIESAAAAFPVGHTLKKIEVAGTAPNERRAVDVHLWYPAATATGPVTVYKSALHGKALPAQWDPLAWSLQSKLAREDAAIDTTSAKPFPVIVFSHGSVNDPHNEATMLETIAAAGFVVASPSHVTDTQDDVRIDYINTQAGSTLFTCNNGLPSPCSRTGAATAAGQTVLNARMVDRARDISAVLDALPGWLGTRADMAKVGVFGHSRGTLSGLGAAAGSATWGVAKEPRVRAVMGMASAGTMAASLQPNLSDIRIPTLIVAGGRDLNSPLLTVNRPMYDQIGCPVGQSGCANPSSEKRLLVLPDAHHRTFLSTFCDQLQASGAVVKAGGSRAILDAHTFNALVTNNNSGNAVDYCPLTAFTTPVDIRPLITNFDFATRSVPTTGLSQDTVTQDMATEAISFFTTELAAVEGGTVGGTVPATLSLTLGPAPSLGAFVPGVSGTYTATGTATVISSAGDAALSVADPSPIATGRLVNGAFSLTAPLLVGGNPLPTTVKTWTGPTSNEAVQLAFSQSIGANEALRTGTYSKTLTFTLSTTRP